MILERGQRAFIHAASPEALPKALQIKPNTCTVSEGVRGSVGGAAGVEGLNSEKFPEFFGNRHLFLLYLVSLWFEQRAHTAAKKKPPGGDSARALSYTRQTCARR